MFESYYEPSQKQFGNHNDEEYEKNRLSELMDAFSCYECPFADTTVFSAAG